MEYNSTKVIVIFLPEPVKLFFCFIVAGFMFIQFFTVYMHYFYLFYHLIFFNLVSLYPEFKLPLKSQTIKNLLKCRRPEF